MSKFIALSAALVLAIGVGCSKKSTEKTDKNDLVTQVTVQKLDRQPSAVSRLALIKARIFRDSIRENRGFRVAGEFAPPAAQPAVQGEVTFTKSEIFNRVFLYGADLQYSSIGEIGWSLLIQSMAVGHYPARFSQVGDRLQLVADQTHLFQSDINHPSRLIHEWTIVREDASTLTVAIRSASATLVTILKDEKSPPARQTWVRSVQYIATGNYLLIETSVEQADGTVAEFMESLFPRETLVPANAKPLIDDPALEPLAKRYGFLEGEKLFLDIAGKGRVQTLVASRFPTPAAGQMIEWYVTPNVPAIYLPILKAGVEGWNRYSQKMWSRDFVRFNGVLPAGVKIGDPRYNIINWDSVPAAGAAYESQAFDPTTGLQSHSLIYLPFAWVKIGEDYWKRGGLSQDDKAARAIAKVAKRGSLLGEKLKLRCMHELELPASLEARTSPEVFARELLKLVLFHEVGHALGLAHNFKGSLSWKPDDATTPKTTSVMDYNQYQLEGSLFSSETSADGPLAEYDRQILSVLYNEGKDVTPTDAVVPACDDERADDYDGGVDPLCLRYDAGIDPTEQLRRTIELVKDENAKLGRTHSLVAALGELKASFGDATQIATETDVDKKIAEIAKHRTGLIAHYYVAGAQSIGYSAKQNVKMLYVLKDELPAPYDSKAMVTRALESLRYAINVAALEERTAEASEQVRVDAEAWVKTTAWYTGLTSPDKDQSVAKKMNVFALNDETILPLIFSKMRTAVLSEIKFRDSVPFLLALGAPPNVDAERAMMEVLEQAITTKLSDGELRPNDERAAAAKALRSFTPVPGSDTVFARVSAIVGGELPGVQDASERAELRDLLKVIDTPPAPKKLSEEEEEEEDDEDEE